MEDLKQIMPKKLGFGCMRLPVANGNSEEIDDAVFCRMIDRYMEQGFVYFDTAYPYHNQKSEEAVRRCLVERYDRERFLLADKGGRDRENGRLCVCAENEDGRAHPPYRIFVP